MYQLHQGLKSKTHTPYVHLDLSPDNFVSCFKDDYADIDDCVFHHGHIDLVPSEFTEKCPDHKNDENRLTRYTVYMPESNNTLTKEQFGLIELKRTLFLPDACYTREHGWIEIKNKKGKDVEYPSVLTKEQLDTHGLSDYINTHSEKGEKPDYTKNQVDALTLCALLIAPKLRQARMETEISNDDIVKSSFLASTIVGLYFNNKCDANKAGSQIRAALKEPVKMKLISALLATNKMDQLDNYNNDETLCKAIDNEMSHNSRCALVHLKGMRLEKYNDSVIKSEEIANAVHALNAPIFLKVNKQPSNDIITVCENEILAKAINVLRLNDGLNAKNYSTVLKNVLNNPEVAKAILHCSKYKVSDEKTLTLSESVNKCKAVNLLVSKVIDNETREANLEKYYLEKVIDNKDDADIINALGEELTNSLYYECVSSSKDKMKAILKLEIKEKITSKMLADRGMRGALYDNSYSQEKLDSLILLFNADCFDYNTARTVKNAPPIFHKVLTLLEEKRLGKYYKKCLDNPELACKLYELLSQHKIPEKLDEIFEKVLKDKSFLKDVKTIEKLNVDDLTFEMLMNSDMRGALVKIGTTDALKDRLKGLVTLYKFCTKTAYSDSQRSQVFTAAIDELLDTPNFHKVLEFLKDKQLGNKCFKLCIENPADASSLYELLSKATDSKLIKYVLDDIKKSASLVKKAHDIGKGEHLPDCASMEITTIKELAAMKAVKELAAMKAVDNGKYLNPNEQAAINQLIRHNKVTKKAVANVLFDSKFQTAIRSAKEGFHIDALLKKTEWQLEQTISQLTNTDNKLILKMLACCKNKPQAEESFKLLESLEGMKQERDQLSTTDVATTQWHAYFACDTVIINLEKKIKQYYNPKTQNTAHNSKAKDFSSFESDCNAIINSNRDNLEELHGFWYHLDNFVTVMVSLIIFYPVTWSVQKCLGSKSTFFNSDAKYILDDIETGIKDVAHSFAPGSQ